MVAVMTFVICFGVNRGVQMVFRYPPKGVGFNLYAAKTEPNDDLPLTLGVRTDHLSFLLCPQQIGENPESDVITVEGFSFHVRYFHVQDRMIRHVALVVGVQITACPSGMKQTAAFLDAYCHAVVREQNRCSYLCTAAHQLTRQRDRCDGPKGSWSALVAAAGDCSLARELIHITEGVQAGGTVELRVNGWLHISSEGPIQLESQRAVGLGDLSLPAASAGPNAAHPGGNNSPTASYGGIQKGALCPQGVASHVDAPRSADRYTYIMVHPELPQPLDKVLMSQSIEIMREVPLPEYLTLIAAPCNLAEFRRQLERKVAAVHANCGASPTLVDTLPVGASVGLSASAKKLVVATSPEMGTLHARGAGGGGGGGGGAAPPAAGRGGGGGTGGGVRSSGALKVSTFNRLLVWLASSGIAHVLRTYYVFQPAVFNQAAAASAAPKRVTRHNHTLRAGGVAANMASLPMQEGGPPGVAQGSGMNHLTLARDVAVPHSPRGTINRQHIERHVVFLEVVARSARPGRSVTGNSVSVIENLRLVIDFLDGRTPKEEILARVPSLTSESLDEVVFVFNEFITTIVA